MVRQSLCAGALIVALLVCATPAWAGEETVPDVVGLSLDEADTLLEEAGFKSTVRYEMGRPIGIVFSQDPGGLCVRDTAHAVTLRVGGPTPKPGPSGDRPPAGTGGADDLGAPPAGAEKPQTLPATLTGPELAHRLDKAKESQD